MNDEAAERHLRRDVPVASAGSAGVWGSDAIAMLLREMRIPYVLLNPGSSFRGLHDSLVNFLGNERPQMLLVPARGARGRHRAWIRQSHRQPLLAIVHSNVGLMHASMAIYNAWCDRVPLLLIGATGPVDAAKRRPWIDWIHTARDQAALVRGFVKWDDQPASVAAAFESLLRAQQIAETAPKGPVYVCLDVSMQEAEARRDAAAARRRALSAAAARARGARSRRAGAADGCADAKRPLILMGRVSRDRRRVERARRAGRGA